MTPQKHLLEFHEKFDLARLTFFENSHWIMSVRPEQLTLGSMVVSSREGLLHFQDLGPEHGADLTYSLGLAEKLARKNLGAVRINVICLMMVDPVVHFHIIPRYQEVIERFGTVWEDKDWPGPPVFRKAETSREVQNALVKELLKQVQ